MKKIAWYIFFLLPCLSHAAIDADAVFKNLRSNSLAAIKAMNAEKDKLSQNSFFAEIISAIPGSFAALLSVFADKTTSVEEAMDSNFFKELFNKNSVISSSETELTYELRASLCKFIDNNMGSKICSVIMNEYSLFMNISSTNNADYELSLSAQLKNSTESHILAASSSYRNATAKTVNLSNIFGFMSHIATIVPEWGETIKSMILSLQGQISFGFRFSSETESSGCMHEARSCLYLNIDREISFDALQSGYALHWQSSPVQSPTLNIFFLSDNRFEVDINSGYFFLDLSDQEEHIKLGRLTTNFIVHPPCNEEAGCGTAEIIIKNLSIEKGKNSVKIAKTGSTFDFLATQDDSKLPTTINYDASGVINISHNPFNLIIKTLSQCAGLRIFEDICIRSTERTEFCTDINKKPVSSTNASSEFPCSALSQLVFFANKLGTFMCEKGSIELCYKNGVQLEERNIQLFNKNNIVEEGSSFSF